MNPNDLTILLVNLAATWFMTGLIWFVQIVHYPMFADVGRSSFVRYETIHQRLTTWVVAPVMLAELGTSALLLRSSAMQYGSGLILSGLVLVVIIWLSTAMLQVPAHNQLQQGFDEKAWRRLVSTNRLRTVAWTARGLCMLEVLRRIITETTTAA